MKRIVILVSALLLALGAWAQPKLRPDNIDEVMKALTLEEKAQLCIGYSFRKEGPQANQKEIVTGIVGMTRAIPRLGIPQIGLSDGPAGVRLKPVRPDLPPPVYATGFPVGTALATTWNTELVGQVGRALGDEFKEYGCDVALCPGMNIHRNPLCGRNFEYFSEDPLLTGKIAAAYIDGIQSYGVGCSAKHFCCNNQETNRHDTKESNTYDNDARVNPRALREIYLKGFEIAVRDAQPWTIMSSYNAMNGPRTQENRELLTTILRDEWGFKGLVMTDWIWLRNTAAQIHAGNDLMEWGEWRQVEDLVNAVKTGRLAESDLDICARRVLELVVKTPRFQGYRYSNKPDLKAHAKVTRDAATEGMVLLKNDGDVLPLKGIRNISLFGQTGYAMVAGGTGSGFVYTPYVVSLLDGLDKAGFSLNGKVADYYKKYVDYQKLYKEANGIKSTKMNPEAVIGADFIKNSVASSDIALVVLGRNAGESHDRILEQEFLLNRTELELLRNVCSAYHEAGKKVVVILNIDGVIETASWKGLPDAILLAWQPGQEAGNSIADVLTGKANPSGKLSMTFPNSWYDLPSSANFPYFEWHASTYKRGSDGKTLSRNIDYTYYEEGIWVGYRYFVTTGKGVSYPFGYGLSYTEFAYSKPAVKLGKDGKISATVTVTNSGSVAGKEVVELYVKAPDGGLVKPERELRAFTKTRLLAPGESQTVTMTLTPYDLASYNEETVAWEAAAGNYQFQFATSSESILAKAVLKLAKPQSWATHAVCLPKQKVNEIKVK